MDQKRLFAAIALSIGILLLFDVYKRMNMPPEAPAPVTQQAQAPVPAVPAPAASGAPVPATQVLTWIGELYGIERRAKKDKLDEQARLELRQRDALDVAADGSAYVVGLGQPGAGLDRALVAIPSSLPGIGPPRLTAPSSRTIMARLKIAQRPWRATTEELGAPPGTMLAPAAQQIGGDTRVETAVTRFDNINQPTIIHNKQQCSVL